MAVVCLAAGVFALWYFISHGLAKRSGARDLVHSDTSRSTAAANEIDPRLIAILTAAVTAAIGRRVVVRRITFINRDTVSGWAEAGRTSIQLSHNLRRTI
jgi:hypothetical protein